MFHIRLGKYGRAFHKPKGIFSVIGMYCRGWRPFSCGGFWSKPSKNQRKLEARSLFDMAEDDFNEVHNAGGNATERSEGRVD